MGKYNVSGYAILEDGRRIEVNMNIVAEDREDAKEVAKYRISDEYGTIDGSNLDAIELTEKRNSNKVDAKVDRKDLSGNYYSTNDFVGTHKLQEQAENIFGKGWEAEDDVAQIESLIKSLGGGYVVSIPEDRSQWNGMREMYDLANPTNDSNYDIFVISESDFKYADGGGVGESSFFDIYDEESGKTLLIKAYSLEQAEGISETIDFNDYEDGEEIDVLDDIANYESGEYSKGGGLEKWSYIRTNGEYNLVKGIYPYKKQVRIGYLKNVNKKGLLETEEYYDVVKLVSELNENSYENFGVAFYLTDLGLSNDKISFDSVFIGYETENDEDNRLNVFGLETPIARYIGGMKKFVKEYHIEKYQDYAKGGVPRNVGRDWLFKSKQDWEQKYDRKREYKEYKKEGWLANWFKDGGEVGNIPKNATVHLIIDNSGSIVAFSTKDGKPLIEKFDEIESEFKNRFSKKKLMIHKEERGWGFDLDGYIELIKAIDERNEIENSYVIILTDGHEYFDIDFPKNTIIITTEEGKRQIEKHFPNVSAIVLSLDNDEFKDGGEVEIVQDKAYGKGYYVIRKYDTNNILHDSIEGLSQAYRVADDNGYEVIYAEGYDNDEFKDGGLVSLGKGKYKYRYFEFEVEEGELNMVKPEFYEGQEIEGNKPTVSEIKSVIADYFDFQNRDMQKFPITKEEATMINKNFSSKEQDNIFGMTFNKYADGGGIGERVGKVDWNNFSMQDVLNEYKNLQIWNTRNLETKFTLENFQIGVFGMGELVEITLHARPLNNYDRFNVMFVANIDFVKIKPNQQGDALLDIKRMASDIVEQFPNYGGYDKEILADGGRVVSNSSARSMVANKSPFRASNLSGRNFGNVYVVESYGYYPLFVYKNGVWYENANKFSASTSKQMSQSRPNAETILSSTKELEGMYKFADGGLAWRGNENAEMVINNNNQIKHHTEELEKIVTPETEVPAWVVSKVNRSASDLSDATHYLDGVSKYEDGGMETSKISTATLEAMVGRKLDGWNDDVVYFNGAKYQKCYLQPFYKLK